MTVATPTRRRWPEFTVAQAAKLARVSPITVRVWVSRKNVKRNVRGKIDGESLLDYLDSRGKRGQHRRRFDPRE
jgi:hypothetical protein